MRFSFSSDLPSRSRSNPQPSCHLLSAPSQSSQALSCLYFHTSRKCTNRSINITFYLPDFLISYNNLSHFSSIHNTLYISGAQRLEITAILVLCQEPHQPLLQEYKTPPFQVLEKPPRLQGQAMAKSEFKPTPIQLQSFLPFHGHHSVFKWRKTEQ